MAEIAGPYDPEVPQLLTHAPLGHLARVTLHPADGEPVTLDLAGAQLSKVTFDEGWTPAIQAEQACKLPAGADLSAIDPRRGSRVTIEAGYLLPDGREDIHPLADLTLRHRRVQYPEGLVSLTAHSDETIVQRGQATAPLAVTTLGAVEAITQIARTALRTQATTVESDLPAGLANGSLPADPIPAGGDYWARLESTADAIGAWVYDDGSRTLHVTNRPVIAGLSRATLATGPGGLIVSVADDTEIDGWANAVVVTHTWTDRTGVDRTIVATASQHTGPMAVEAVGTVTLAIEQPTATTQAAADAEAKTLLARALRRGRTETVTAIACYWLRPGMTVTRDTPGRERRRVLVAAVEFELGTGLMHVTMRDPEIDSPDPEEETD